MTLCLQHRIYTEIYDKGYDQGYKDGVDSMVDKTNYERGLEDAWDITRKLTAATADYLLADDKVKVFGTNSLSAIMETNTAQEAIDKIKAWEEKLEQVDDDIKIGDVVNAPGFHAPVVVIALCDYDSVKVMSSFGDTGVHPKCNVTKTGGHFNQISEVLELLKGEKYGER